MAYQQKKVFYGKNRPKANRRSNGSGKVRKYYAYVTEAQKGTAMETQITSNYAMYDRLMNSRSNAGNPSTMAFHDNDVTGKLRTDWKNIYKSGIYKSVRDIMKRTKLRGLKAKKAAEDMYLVHFGADPKTK